LDFQLENTFPINKPLPEEIAFPDRHGFITFVPNTHILAVRNSEDLIFLDVESWRIVEAKIDPSPLDFSSSSEIVSTDGNLLISMALNENRILFLDAASNAYLGEMEPYFQFSHILFSRDGRLLIFVSGDGILHVWGVEKE
jgi:hypothetical protein